MLSILILFLLFFESGNGDLEEAKVGGKWMRQESNGKFRGGRAVCDGSVPMFEGLLGNSSVTKEIHRSTASL